MPWWLILLAGILVGLLLPALTRDRTHGDSDDLDPW